MDTQKLNESLHAVGSAVKANGQLALGFAEANKRTLIKVAIIFVILSGWFYAAWNGGMMGLWACFCSGVAGYIGGLYTK